MFRVPGRILPIKAGGTKQVLFPFPAEVPGLEDPVQEQEIIFNLFFHVDLRLPVFPFQERNGDFHDFFTPDEEL